MSEEMVFQVTVEDSMLPLGSFRATKGAKVRAASKQEAADIYFDKDEYAVRVRVDEITEDDEIFTRKGVPRKEGRNP